MCFIKARRTQACVKVVPSLYAVVRRQQCRYPSEAERGGVRLRFGADERLKFL